ncbi:Serine/threonine-protein phosphatase 6 regulatory ankyrin repeat subunit B [Blattella germanica]|nr:Serine/threonine-protein phosphatase 6 regulatory ankyrin repeat subunit B [Blattella germanica]
MTMEERRRALRAAAEAGNTSEVQILLRADTYHSASDKEGYTPLHWAAARGHLDVTRLLIESGARLENRGGRKFLFTPLHMASGARVKALDRYRDTALHWAAWFGHLPVVKLLVEKGAIVGAKNTDGHTAEDMAALRRQHHVTEWLREQ